MKYGVQQRGGEGDSINSSTGPRGSYETDAQGLVRVRLSPRGRLDPRDAKTMNGTFGACNRGLRGPNEDPARLER